MYKRERHRLIHGLLGSMNRGLIERAECAFGGGTLIAMQFGEYRESADIDFLCSTRRGFRLLREELFGSDLAPLLGPLVAAREPIMDRDAIRTFIRDPSGKLPPVRFEIVLEARIDIEIESDAKFPVPRLTGTCLMVEKLLANVDRGAAESESGKDFVDLLALVRHAPATAFARAFPVATGAYGSAVRLALEASIKAHSDPEIRRARLARLGVVDAWFDNEAKWKSAILAALKRAGALAAGCGAARRRPGLAQR